MRIGNPLPTSLPQECRKAAKIFKGFVGTSNGLDGLIPTQVLRSAHGFAIFTVVKAGFLMSVRAGTGLVIARLSSGEWSAPSAIGTGGMGFGGQAGAEVTEFILVLNSKAAIRQFMSAGSITLGGNMSVALGPIGRNAEGSGALNTKGKVAAMYSYSKTKGAFAGISIEGSAIFERQDCNVKSYGSNVTSTALLSGQIDQPDFAMDLIQTLTSRAGGMTEYVNRNPRSSSIDDLDRDFSHDPESNAGWRESGRDSVTRNFESPPPSRATYEFGDSNPFATSGKREEKSNMLKKSFKPSMWRTKSDKTGSDTQYTGEPQPSWVQLPQSYSSSQIQLRKENPFHGSISPSPPETTINEQLKPNDSNSSYGLFGDLEPMMFGRIKQEITPISERNGFDHSTVPDLDRLSFSSSESSSERHQAHSTKASPPFSKKNNSSPTTAPTQSGNALMDDLMSFDQINSSGYFHPKPISKPVPSSTPDIFVNNTQFGLSESKPPRDMRITKPANEADFLVGTVMPSVRRTNTESVGPLGKAVAVYDFKPTEEGDLGFQKGDMIKIESKIDDDWWTGSIGMRKGIFPRNRVEPLDH